MEADPNDLASRYEERNNETLLKLHGMRHQPQPEYDERGQKICIECGFLIPPLRAAIDWVSTCVPCQQILERKR